MLTVTDKFLHLCIFSFYNKLSWWREVRGCFTCHMLGGVRELPMPNHLVTVLENVCMTTVQSCCSVKSVLHEICNISPMVRTERMRFGLIALLFDRPAVSLFLHTLHNPTDGHGSLCHSSPTQRLSLPFCLVNWLALNLSVKMGRAPRLSSQNGFEIR